jgi:large subunit ribosomal protein L46
LSLIPSQTAQRALTETAGVNMNTWLVGHAPVAHLVRPPQPARHGAIPALGSMTFFIKGRIMAGQANLAGNTLGYSEFQWLTRDEIKTVIPGFLFRAVVGMMPER